MKRDGQNNFKGGLNTALETDSLGKNELRLTENARISSHRGVAKRFGSRRLTALPFPTPIMGGHEFVTLGSGVPKQQLLVVGGELVVMSTTSPIIGTGGNGSFARTAGTWTIDGLIGYRVYFNNCGPFTITDNTATGLVFSGDATGATSISSLYYHTLGTAAVVVTQTAAAGASWGDGFTTQPIVAITDAAGYIRTADNSTVVTATVSTGAAIVGTATATASSGIATFTNLGITGTAGETYTLTYTGAGGLIVGTQSITLPSTVVVMYRDTFAGSGSLTGHTADLLFGTWADAPVGWGLDGSLSRSSGEIAIANGANEAGNVSGNVLPLTAAGYEVYFDFKGHTSVEWMASCGVSISDEEAAKWVFSLEQYHSEEQYGAIPTPYSWEMQFTSDGGVTDTVYLANTALPFASYFRFGLVFAASGSVRVFKEPAGGGARTYITSGYTDAVMDTPKTIAWSWPQTSPAMNLVVTGFNGTSQSMYFDNLTVKLL